MRDKRFVFGFYDRYLEWNGVNITCLRISLVENVIIFCKKYYFYCNFEIVLFNNVVFIFKKFFNNGRTVKRIAEVLEIFFANLFYILQLVTWLNTLIRKRFKVKNSAFK